ncbi:hypothetical protein E2C01_008187 [Portunus trituberculatus]|uniref:Uncharacterized protein n=1 Tax=Portunus trituberculatus TaxID=210409 RepID=A0A5B7D048_PORTR|nr:hypothetical protein [Portunus trituberculatus]
MTGSAATGAERLQEGCSSSDVRRPLSNSPAVALGNFACLQPSHCGVKSPNTKAEDRDRVSHFARALAPDTRVAWLGNGSCHSPPACRGCCVLHAASGTDLLPAQQHLLETQELHAQVTEFEDKLADARLENTKLKNEIIDQKTNFEIQLCDLQTKVNEYEESRLLVGSARRLPGLRTRLELNWQKEREEQQRLIQETATLAKDLRQTLYEVERERDLEKLEAKRKIDQLKKTVGQETSDTKTKVQELQRDLQELREAHAKLRQINEKLRREKDRTEVEREAMRDKYLGSSREHLHQQSKMDLLAEEVRHRVGWCGEGTIGWENNTFHGTIAGRRWRSG